MPGLLAFFGLDSSAFKNGLDESVRQAQGAASKMSGIFSNLGTVLTVGGAIAGFKRITAGLEDIRKEAKVFDLTTDDVQKLSKASGKLGLDFEDVARSISKIGTTRREAVEGNEDLRKQYAGFGISVRDLNDASKSNLDIWMQIAKAVDGVKLNPAQKQELIDFMGKGGDRMAAVMKELQTMGPINLISKEEIDRLTESEKIIKRISGGYTSRLTHHLATLAGDIEGVMTGDTLSDKAKSAAKGFWDFTYGGMVNLFTGKYGPQKQPTSAADLKRPDLYGPSDAKMPYEPLWHEKDKAEKTEQKKADAAEKTAKGMDRATSRNSLNSYEAIGGYAGAASASVGFRQLQAQETLNSKVDQTNMYLNRLIQLEQKKYPNYHPQAQTWQQYKETYFK